MTDYVELWGEEREWFDALVMPYVDLLGEGGVILIVGVFYFISLTWYTEDIRPAAVLIILYAGVWVFGAPAQVALIFGLVATLAVALAYMSIYGLREQR